MKVDKLVVPLDTAGRHRLRGKRAGWGWELVLEHSEGSRRSPLHDALREHLVLVAGGLRCPLESAEPRARVPASGDLTVSVGAALVAQVDHQRLLADGLAMLAAVGWHARTVPG